MMGRVRNCIVEAKNVLLVDDSIVRGHDFFSDHPDGCRGRRGGSSIVYRPRPTWASISLPDSIPRIREPIPDIEFDQSVPD